MIKRRGKTKCAAHGALLALLMAGSMGAEAQLVPRVQLPDVPSLPTDQIDRTLAGALDASNARSIRELRDARKLRIRNLLRINRAELERDPRGAPIMRNEIVALSPTPQALDQARAAGFTIGNTRLLGGLDVSIVVLQAPPGLSTRRALERLRREDPAGTYDYNHLYTESGEVTQAAAETDEAPRTVLRDSERRVGLIDGGVQAAHPVFQGTMIHQHGCSGAGVPSAHGTAVASLLVGSAEQFQGVAPGAQLFVADVYCGLATGGSVDAVAEAFAWLARQHVPVINISLVGPPNALLERVVRLVAAKGHIIVAAVGNDGPSAPPLYPAAYPEVIAVTAVDARRRILLEACRGQHVDFSALGADMTAANLDSKFAPVRGTSFAAPIVAGLLAEQFTRIDKQAAALVTQTLIDLAVDLGARGRDRTYGNGLLGEQFRPTPSLSQR